MVVLARGLSPELQDLEVWLGFEAAFETPLEDVVELSSEIWEWKVGFGLEVAWRALPWVESRVERHLAALRPSVSMRA